MDMTNTPQKIIFCINPYFLEQLKVNKTCANTFVYTGSPVGNRSVAFVPPIPGLFSQRWRGWWQRAGHAAVGAWVPLQVWVVVGQNQGCCWVAMLH